VDIIMIQIHNNEGLERNRSEEEQRTTHRSMETLIQDKHD